MDKNNTTVSYVIGGNSYNITRVFSEKSSLNDIITQKIKTEIKKSKNKDGVFTNSSKNDIINNE